MSYTSKTLKIEAGSKPIPQHFNPTADDFEPLYGRNNAMRVELYGADGNVISVVSSKLAVRSSEIETLLSSLDGKDFATQTTVAAILSKIIAAPSTEAKQDSIIGYVDGIEAALTTLNSKDFATQTTLASILTQLSTTGLKKIIDALPAGDNNIGNVDVLSLPALPEGSNIIGSVKLSDGTDVLAINTNGSINLVPYNSGGTELFTAANPGNTKIVGTITPAHTAVTVGTTSVTVLAANSSRKYAIIANISDSTVFLTLEGSTAVADTGLPLASGQAYEISPMIGNLFTGIIKGISTAASKKVLVTEGT